MLKRPQYIVLVLVVVLTLLRLKWPSKTTARLKLGIGSFFVPLSALANSADRLAGRAGDAVLPRSEVVRENNALKQQNQELRLQTAREAELAHENDRLRKLLGWQQQQPRKYKLANVVLHDPANWWRTVQIDLGARDGVKVNMA